MTNLQRPDATIKPIVEEKQKMIFFGKACSGKTIPVQPEMLENIAALQGVPLYKLK